MSTMAQQKPTSSFQRHLVIRCDSCGNTLHTGRYETEIPLHRTIDARNAGWHRKRVGGRLQDFCPSCYAQFVETSTQINTNQHKSTGGKKK